MIKKKAIGDELVKWNATRFGTNYIFLDREEKEFRSDDTTPEPSGDDGGRGWSDDGDAGGSGWVRGSGGAGWSSGQVSPLQFTGETNFTHATQDQDHGAPTSQRQTRSSRRARSTPKDDDDSNSCSSAFTYPPEPTYPYPYLGPHEYDSSSNASSVFSYPPQYAPHLQLPPPYRGRLPPQQPIHLIFWLPSAYGLQVCICLSVFIQSFVHLSYSLHLINVGTIL